MPKLSVCSVVRNESEIIADFIDHCKTFADEVCIVDQTSDDGTYDTIKEMADGWAQDPAYGYCEKSRELAESLATGDWILILGASDRITEDFRADLQRFMADEQYDGYRLVRRCIWTGMEPADQPLGQYRLFRKGKRTYLDELHTEAQPVGRLGPVTPYIAIVSERSIQRRLEDEERYENLILGWEANEEWKKARLAINILRNSRK
jgi:glycosyltransferase involved in cell wall biosynthesis